MSDPRMPQGARDTRCPECGHTYGTHRLGCPRTVEERDERAFFEIWWAIRRESSWKRGGPIGPAMEHWGEGFKQDCWAAWYGRATLHVVGAKDWADGIKVCAERRATTYGEKHGEGD